MRWKLRAPIRWPFQVVNHVGNGHPEAVRIDPGLAGKGMWKWKWGSRTLEGTEMNWSTHSQPVVIIAFECLRAFEGTGPSITIFSFLVLVLATCFHLNFIIFLDFPSAWRIVMQLPDWRWVWVSVLWLGRGSAKRAHPPVYSRKLGWVYMEHPWSAHPKTVKWLASNWSWTCWPNWAFSCLDATSGHQTCDCPPKSGVKLEHATTWLLHHPRCSQGACQDDD